MRYAVLIILQQNKSKYCFYTRYIVQCQTVATLMEQFRPFSIIILACYYFHPLFCRKNLRAARLSDLIKVYCSKVSLNRFRLKLRRNFTVEFASNPSRSSIKSSVSLQGIFVIFPTRICLKVTFQNHKLANFDLDQTIVYYLFF